MLSYIYGDYVYFNKNIDSPNKHHNRFMLTQIPGFYITSPSNLMNELPYQSCGSVIKSLKMEQRQSTNGTNVYYKRGMDEYFELF